jgi:phosphotransferase system enzyme I (PtsP)
MRSTLAGPRVLLRRLREVMAEPVGAQERLDKIVVLIAANVVAEVCSIYVMRADGSLELYATEGLNRDAVHKTTMAVGEGLVGLIAKSAEPLAIADAQNHPAFSYKVETGEESFTSFLGVPILRNGDTIGVLVVQNRVHRIYEEEEIEALQTTAMVLAEIISAGDFQALATPEKAIAVRRPLHLRGDALSEGIGLGHVVLHEPRVHVKNIIATDLNAELDRLEIALEAVRQDIDSLVERGDSAGAGEHMEVLEAVRMVAHDKGWLRRLREAVRTGLTAEAAVERVQSDNRARMMRAQDAYLRERLHDLDDLANRLLHALVGRDFVLERSQLPDNAVLVARSLAPAALLEYDRERLRGLVLEEGGVQSHVAVVARALGIPAISQIANITGLVEPGDAIIADGLAGDVQLRPTQDVQAAYAEKARMRARRQEQYRALRHLLPFTRDGLAIDLCLNAGLAIDLPHLDDTGAAGIGLFRSELQFMISERLPRASEQFRLYQAVLAASGERPVTFRTLDIGGDKILPYQRLVEEENPALGWRAIRIGLDRPGLLRHQLRALLKAGAGRRLRIMFPMVATLEEYDAAMAIAARELGHAERFGYTPPLDVQWGVMVEVPSLVFQIEAVARRVDFLSIGTNDLMQYLFAADRENPRLARRYDPLSPAAMHCLRRIVDAARSAGKPISVCGEMASRPIEAMALIALGIRSLSMNAAAIGPVKAMLLELDAGRLAGELESWLVSAEPLTSLRPRFETFAADNGIPI